MRIDIDSMPEEIDSLVRQKMQLEIERKAIQKEEQTEDNIKKIDGLNKTINELDEKITKLKTQWELEKNSIMDEAQIKEEIEKTKAQIDIAERDADLERAAELKYGKMIELQKRLEDVQKMLKKNLKISF